MHNTSMVTGCAWMFRDDPECCQDQPVRGELAPQRAVRAVRDPQRDGERAVVQHGHRHADEVTTPPRRQCSLITR